MSSGHRLGGGILIITTGRAGSSMIANIVADHGVWTGHCREPSVHNAKGFFENVELKREQRKFYGLDVEGPAIPERNSLWEAKAMEILERQGATNPWLYKTGALYYRAWEPIVDHVIKIYRPHGDVMASYERCGFLDARKNNLPLIIKRQIEIMEGIDAPTVDTKAVVEGDYTTLEDAISSCGLEFKEEIADRIIEKNLYNL